VDVLGVALVPGLAAAQDLLVLSDGEADTVETVLADAGSIVNVPLEQYYERKGTRTRPLSV